MSRFVISLDFELMWGLRDHATARSYGRNVLGARDAIAAMLDLFERHGVHATWATVGLLMCEDKAEMIARAGQVAVRPQYDNPALDNLDFLQEVGENEKDDPLHFGLSLVRRIQSCPDQEIASHSFAHHYMAEPGASAQSFSADLEAALSVAKARSIALKSYVFPRNQTTSAALQICAERGITCYRGVAPGWPYRAGAGRTQTKARRAARLMDAHLGLWPSACHIDHTTSPINVPASQFLRPKAGKLAKVHVAHIAAIKRAMRAAARKGANYHLWWHPHNFGRHTEDNLAALEDILVHFARLKESHGMQSATMINAAERSAPYA